MKQKALRSLPALLASHQLVVGTTTQRLSSVRSSLTMVAMELQTTLLLNLTAKIIVASEVSSETKIKTEIKETYLYNADLT